METKYFNILLVTLTFLSTMAFAQPSKGWDQEKIIGKQYYLPGAYHGSPYLIQGWRKGTICFSSGQKISGLNLKYDGLNDELVYVNELYHTMVQIEKSTVDNFYFSDQGISYYFERRYFDGFLKGDRYFQVFHKGDVDLLGSFRVELINTTVYKDASGNTKNMEYLDAFRYFLYRDGEGYHSTSLRKKSLLKYFSKAKRREVNRLMRVNHIQFKTPEEFSRALSILEANNINLEF